MKIASSKVLVTGAGGFIGSHLTEELIHLGASVRAMVHYDSRNDWGQLDLLPDKIKKSLEVVTGDVRDYLAVRKALQGCDTVFHLAALIGIPYSYVAPEEYVNTNIKGTLNVLQASLDENVAKVIHTSSSEVYGTAIYTPIDEKHPLQAQSPYSASKIGADKIVESYYLSFNLPVAILRPFNTYGPRQSARAVIPTIISQALLSDSKIKLGSLAPVRDFSFIRDTLDGFIRMAEIEESIGKTINIGSGKGIAIGELVERIGKIIGKKIEVEINAERIRPQKSEVFELICDNKLAKKILNWEPRYPLDKGLSETVRWIKSNINVFKSGIYNI